jgi:acetolactate synthase-1/2/3 large subunit/5-guanidino-2-oxopentanoate decarboxylase
VRIFKQADLILAVGTELSQVDLWRNELGHDCPMIRVDVDASQMIGKPNADDLHVLGDAGSLMRAVCDCLEGHMPQTAWRAVDVAAARAQWRRDVDAERPGILPVCDALREILSPETMIYSDMTQFAYAAKEVWDMERPGHWHHPYGFGTLGYALPAAIGGAVARRGKPTMAIIGDYGFHYTLQELGVAVELGLSLPILLWDNGKLKEIEDSMTRAQIAPRAVVARNPDFCKLAQAFGARAQAPQSLAAFQSAVRDAFSSDGPTLIHITPKLAV